jgi:ABC-type Zn uptake system ZnuABC Zn-binding protein ZnuA
MSLFFFSGTANADKLKVVTTITDYADIVKQIGGDQVEVKAIIEGSQDAHFIRPRPSFVEMLRQADMLVATGLDLEMWLPSAVDKSGNRKIRSEAIGYVSVATDMPLKDKPVSMSKIDGGLHIYGNPHITVSPLNVMHIAENIKIGLSRNLPEKKDFFAENLNVFLNRLCIALYGNKLVEMLGRETLVELHRTGRLYEFLETKKFKGQSLASYAGGWLGKLLPFKGTKIVTYHKNWRYFFDDFALVEAGFIEPKPGIPPSPRHLKQLRDDMRKQKVPLVIAANYFDEKTVKKIAVETGAEYLMLPYYVGGSAGVNSWFDLMNFWVDSITGKLK